LGLKKQKKAMEVATSPGKALMMTAFMMWMSGSQLNIFTITTVSGALLNPVRGLITTNATFKNYEDADGHTNLLQPKLIYIALQLVALSVGLYKMSTMGLLPTNAGDFMNYLNFRTVVEVSGVAI
jgi:ER membrane protein complex subunit 4